MYKRRFLSFVLAAIIVFSSLPVISVSAIDTNATRGYVINEFVYAVGKNNLTQPKKDISTYDDYNKIDEQYTDAIEIALGNDLLKGYEDNTLRAEQEITRVEALAMLSRALKDLPKTAQSQGFTDTPEWANADIERLANAGVVLGYGDGTFGAQDEITIEQVGLLTDRIDKQFDKVRPQDDFYGSVNAKWFRNNTIPDGHVSWAVFDQMQEQADEQLHKMIKSFVDNKDSYQKGSNEQKIADLYLSALDMKKRDEIGIAPIKPYLDGINQAKNMNELVQEIAIIEKNTGSFSLLPFEIRADMKNSDKNMLYLTQSDTGMDAYHFYDPDNDDVREAYKKYLTKLFTLSGDTTVKAKEKTNRVFAMEKDLSRFTLNYQDYQDVDKIYNIYPINKLDDMFENADIKAYFKTAGLDNVDNITVEGENLLTKVCDYVNNESNLELMKNYAEAVILDDSASCLTTEFRQAVRDMNQVVIKTNGDLSDEQIALNITTDGMGWQLGKLYADQYFSESAKQDIEKMVHEMIAVYEKRIKDIDWMSDTTKANAIKKLDAMRIKIGYPDEWPTYMNDAEILSTEDGGTLFGNIANLYSDSIKYNISQLNQPANHEEWNMYPQDVNAYYSPSGNEIVFPAGILQKPFYDINASKEQNLGGIGFIIAHEITHAFDVNGAEYDEKGNAHNWWTKEDYNNFEKLTKAFIDRYGEIEVLDGKKIDGEFTLNENIADMGAMSCILDIAKGMDKPDLDTLFKRFASIWAEVSTDSSKEYFLNYDNHAPNKFRTNVVLESFQEFYNLYHIMPEDGMYVPPPKRIRIW